MKPLLLLPALALLLAACGDVGDAPVAQTGAAVDLTTAEGVQIPIDPQRSEVTWRGAKVTGAHDGGFNTFDGSVTVREGTVTGVDVRIDMNSLYSDNDDLTGHLLSDDFFSAPTHPEGSFVATSFEPAASDSATHMVTGNLTMRGNTNSVTFPATINVTDDMVTAMADFIIDRQQWGITYAGRPDDLISDNVRIMFDIVAAPGAAAVPADAGQQMIEMDDELVEPEV
jgi:polyisoprenoid-binding protein YceI